jgi:sterol desaturase/sphingolipid hydroxylase (fatty acid hydroxylase superfamily)
VALATRAELRPTIADSYSFVRHAILLHVLALGAIGGALAFLRDVQQLELIAIPATFLFSNLVEYFAHRYPMHHPWRGLGALYERHAVYHHAYFRSDSMQINDMKDMRYVVFSWEATLAAIFTAAAGGAGVALLAGKNAGLLFGATATLYYLVYEWFHASFHFVAIERLAWIPILGTAAKRHRLHHDPERMTQANFNITFPIVDRIAGTIADS